MKLNIFILSLCAVVGFLCACRHQTTHSGTVVPPPRFVPAAADTSAIEYGIDAVPEADAIFLQWYKHSSYDGFRLFRRAQDETTFTLIAALSPTDTTYLDPVAINTRYFYYLQACDEDDNWSEPSDTVNYMLLPKSTALNVVFATPLEFSWKMKGINPPQFIVRLYDDSADEMVWLSKVASSYQGGEEKIRYNWDNKAKLDPLVVGKRYRWRVDCLDHTPFTGSESNWHRFLML